MANPDFERALRCARHFRSLGYNPLPSKMDVKGPALGTYAEFWEAPLPDSVFEDWRTGNIQLMCGCRWRLGVVDCDGPEAIATFEAMATERGALPPTWVSQTGGGGLHVYFGLPEFLDELPSKRLWGLWDPWLGDWVKHREIRLLADKSLVIAPPSIHVKTNVRYEFRVGSSPREIPRPAMIPDWILRLPEVVRPKCVRDDPPVRLARTHTSPSGLRYRREDVLAAIPDKLAVARSWGLKVASRHENAAGFVRCHSVLREHDETASASFKPSDGFYSEKGEGVTLSLFDLGALIGGYSSWQECRDALGDQFRARPADAAG
ncbi:MAG: bifunctional DNA primase/polymerase [Isosphaeraceae bacterium]|nr:bifunctional DNA primase/polymerase [Isosphaeraceae bacterium]